MGLNKLRWMKGERPRRSPGPPTSTDPRDLPGQTLLFPAGPELPLFRPPAGDVPRPIDKADAPGDLPGQTRLF